MTALPVGTHGHVVGPGYRVAGEVVEVAPASVRVRYVPPGRSTPRVGSSRCGAVI